MSLIKVSDLTFCYEGSYDNIFEKVSFQIDSDWKLGFVGRNGKGKTTFLQLLLGKYEYIGSIQSSVIFQYFPVNVPKDRWTDNVIDVLEEEFPEYELWRVIVELNLLQMEADILYRPYETLSFGERTRVMLAYLFSTDNSFLLLDEPTNHLDIETRDMVRAYLGSKKGFVLVSHERDLLDSCVDHILALNRSTINVTRGNFSIWWENKERQDNYELNRNESLKKDIRRLEASAKRMGAWGDKAESTKIGFNPIKEDRDIGTRSYIGAKTKKMQQRRKTTEKRKERQLEEKKGLLKDIEQEAELKLFPADYYKETLAAVDDITIKYDERTVCTGISFRVKNGDRVLLKGKNGCGKSSLIKMLLGEIKPESGSYSVGSNVKISYVSQDTSYLKGSLKAYASAKGVELSLLMSVLRQLDFERVQFEKNMEEYSEGQKKKVLLGASLCQQAHLYIWDEPMNYIDIFSRMQLEKLILKYQPTMLFVEHDKVFGEKVATKVISI